MNIIKFSIIYITIVINTTYASNVTYGKENNDHLCEETRERLTGDGDEVNLVTISVCCSGYTNDEINDKCVPHCESGCRYGFCKAPNVCECSKGYKMIKGECVPMCKNKCVNGYCSKPDVCGCLKGFEIDTNNFTSCMPICRPKCSGFTKCTKSIKPAPNRCQCITGYTENNKTKICEPICENICYNGYCSAPNTCSCFEGFELDNTNKTKCIPKCKPKCRSHSSCVAPNKCVCNDGYKLNNVSNTCEAICVDKIKYSQCIEPPNTWICIKNYQHDLRIDKCVLESCSCENGYCLEHENECECYAGYTKNDSTKQCDSLCQPNCINSICDANNMCQCLNGYHKTNQDHICESNDMCNGQSCENGECLITGVCKCKSGYVNSLSYNGQSKCDKIQTFVGKVVMTLLGIPMILAIFALLAIYIINKKKINEIEEQEMVLIERR